MPNIVLLQPSFFEQTLGSPSHIINIEVDLGTKKNIQNVSSILLILIPAVNKVKESLMRSRLLARGNFDDKREE